MDHAGKPRFLDKAKSSIQLCNSLTLKTSPLLKIKVGTTYPEVVLKSINLQKDSIFSKAFKQFPW